MADELEPVDRTADSQRDLPPVIATVFDGAGYRRLDRLRGMCRQDIAHITTEQILPRVGELLFLIRINDDVIALDIELEKHNQGWPCRVAERSSFSATVA